jgi:DNA-directed RNA polymerase sigma subunit (sigma70/sigma32)
MEDREYQDRLYSLIDATPLTSCERKILMIRIQSNAPWKQIAKRLDLTEDNCRQAYHRATRKLIGSAHPSN